MTNVKNVSNHAATWYWLHNGQRHGPLGTKELRSLARAGSISPATLVWREGLPEWIRAESLRGLFPAAPPPTESMPDRPAVKTRKKAIETARQHAATIVSDIKQLDYRNDIMPIDAASLQAMCRDSVFWCVLGLGVIPLLIGTISQQDHQLTLFALFFAILWGFVFKYSIIRTDAPWRWLIGSLFFTGTLGIWGLLTVYQYLLPAAYMQMAGSETVLVSLVGFIVQVGACEELCKLFPVIGYLLWKRGQADPMKAILIGVFSGLGFAAFENMSYSKQSVVRSYGLASEYGVEGLVAGVEGAMITVLLRSLSLVFCHAIWSGISAYFLVMSVQTQRPRVAVLLIGLALVATLHGVYDWFDHPRR